MYAADNTSYMECVCRDALLPCSPVSLEVPDAEARTAEPSRAVARAGRRMHSQGQARQHQWRSERGSG